MSVPVTIRRMNTVSRIIGSGEMADRIRAFDWNRCELGPIESWSDALITTVNILLASRHPMFLWWGPKLIQFYNDGFRPSIREDKHPAALGQRGMDCWPEIWSIIGPQIEASMIQGESSWNRNQLVPINRSGKLEEVYWTYSYSPVRDAEGQLQGTLVVCSDTTDQVLGERRSRALLAINAKPESEEEVTGPAPLLESAQNIVQSLTGNAADIPFVVLYLIVDGEVVEAGNINTTSRLLNPAEWPLAEVVAAKSSTTLEGLQNRFGELVRDPWPEPVTRAFVSSLPMPGSSIQGALVFGISPRLVFDDSYKTFFQLVGNRVAALLQREVHELELARAAKRFRNLAEADPFGMIIGNFRGEMNYVNPVFLKTLGFTEAEVAAGKLRWDQITPAEYAEADARAAEQLRTRGRCDVYEKEFFTKDQRRLPILIGGSVLEIFENDSEIVAFVTDLTPLKAAEEALRKANEGLERKVAERTAELKAEVSDRQRAEMSLRELTGRLLIAQDEERRHMARELHDHAGQTLTALGMNLSAMHRAARNLDPKIGELATESKQLSDDLSKEIRTLSYLLHPPLLDESGLVSALRWYVDGFSERSKIAVKLDVPEDMKRLPRELELVVFRVVQESLTNVHRHSGSSSVRIYLARTKNEVAFEISDLGKGISQEKQGAMTAARSGVGVRGMNERVRQFGGTFKIASSREGTRVTVTLPVRDESE